MSIVLIFRSRTGEGIFNLGGGADEVFKSRSSSSSARFFSSFHSAKIKGSGFSFNALVNLSLLLAISRFLARLTQWSVTKSDTLLHPQKMPR